MKKNTLAILLSLLFTTASAVHLKPYLEIYGDYNGEVAGNVAGGIRKGCVYSGQYNLGIAFYSDEICKKWKGAEIRFDIQGTHGPTVPSDLVGDIQAVSNFAIGDYPVYFNHLYYSQEIGPVRFIIGLQDFNDEYDCLDSPADFINSAWTFSPLFANVYNAPSSPNTALAFDFKWNINDMWAWQAAVYDTPYALDEETNKYNINWKFTKEKGCQVLTEFHCTPVFGEDLDGAYKLGATYQTQTQSWGIYADLEQAVYSTPEHKLWVFAKGGYMPKLDDIDGYAHVGAGVSLFGVFDKEQNDMMGLAFSTAMLRPTGNIHQETAIEWTYKYNFLDHIYIQPDIQYIISPGWEPELNTPNSLLLMLRFGAWF